MIKYILAIAAVSLVSYHLGILLINAAILGVITIAIIGLFKAYVMD